jgi:hypothetical protein
MLAGSAMIASLLLGTRVARSWLAVTGVPDLDETPSGAQRLRWAVTWGVTFGCAPPRPSGHRQRGAATGTAAKCRSRDANSENDDANSEKRQSGDYPHFHEQSLSRFMPPSI